ncbi:MAG: flagellar biosynthetic protein FliO [Liquorilactobacillus sp.]|uniref:flagellar biosynthetic protein FliO n=1 Tax=Liquorilactobacillus nagelii TaxID=82688 RepID=UPI0039E9FA32
MGMFLTVIKLIMALLIVIYLINVFLKFLNHYSLKTNKTFRIIQKIPVSKSSSVGIVQIVDHFYVMSFSEQASQILFELSSKDAEELLKEIGQDAFGPKPVINQNFSNMLARAKQSLQNKKRNKE